MTPPSFLSPSGVPGRTLDKSGFAVDACIVASTSAEVEATRKSAWSTVETLHVVDVESQVLRGFLRVGRLHSPMMD